eukprot:GFKZ01003428.1.p2 GENE.GFKZ01003428.1~~GFKZ01003428.1.p2  ORF type:complete len:371 (-),score=80.02 GFKZ01003428.1:3978-5090(-)
MGRLCELCPDGKQHPATVFCPADECFLCGPCDDVVHSANRLASRHIRRPVLDADDPTDGSSINDDSELGLVPDVGGLSSGSEDKVSDPGSSQESLLMGLPQGVPVSFEDAAEYDFVDFGSDGLEGRMPALCAIDDGELFGDSGKALGKSFGGEMSWENVVPEGIEHVVPDVGEGKGGLFLKREPLEVEGKGKDMIDDSALVVEERCVEEGVTQDGRVKGEDVVMACLGEVKESTTVAVSGRKRGREAVEDGGAEEAARKGGEKSEVELEKEKMERTAEQRKKRRMEALARFRSKRANRSFTKKVRYECRKQLADSRPRVKGRFVRKIEMALYRKYGALYREHLDELKTPEAAKLGGKGRSGAGDQCVPAM